MAFTGYRVVVAEGARVGFVVCHECGASILLDPSTEFDAGERHEAWHRSVLAEG